MPLIAGLSSDRHLSEVSKQKKGGYLEAKIRVPTAGDYFLELSLAPAEEKVRRKKTLQQLEPVKKESSTPGQWQATADPPQPAVPGSEAGKEDPEEGRQGGEEEEEAGVARLGG